MGWFSPGANAVSSAECEFVCLETQQIHHGGPRCVFFSPLLFCCSCYWVPQVSSTSREHKHLGFAKLGTEGKVRLHLSVLWEINNCTVGKAQLGWTGIVGWNAAALTCYGGGTG